VASPPLLELDRVTVLRGERPALDRVTLRIDVGERVCILGPNGSGKSTLVKTLTRECYPTADEGSVLIMGKDRWDVAELRAHLGIVSPDLLALCTSDATAREVVLSGFFSSARVFAHHHVLPELEARADEALSRVGAAHLRDRSLLTLSSGEAKRILVARALVHDPGSLLFDEPVNTLDIGAQAHLKGAMRSLARAGVGIILVTHHVSEIIPEIDRVILLAGGKVVADGPKAQVLTEPALSSLFGVEAHLFEHAGYFFVY
jgi:iron complex transport system ATP-binding protein